MKCDETRTMVLEVMETVLELQLRAVRQALGEEDAPRGARRRGGTRRQSIVDQAIRVLTERGRPMHVNELVRALMEDYGRVTDRDTVSSALAKKARQGVLMCQTAPATFSLLKGAGE